MRHDNRIRRRCARVLADLDIPQPFDFDVFCAHVAHTRDRPLYVHPLPKPLTPAHPYGATLRTRTADHIFVEQATSAWHRTVIGCHEVSHLLLGHHGVLTDLVSALAPSLDPTTIDALLARQSYDTVHEQEAETLAGMILNLAYPLPVQPRQPVGEHVLTHRLADTLGLPDERVT
ncbi:hypothetical protein [Catenuloplanes indicus]|uniref:IrrE N-terminal-like domain-containing protein n=1 Tax=Catenuloplanes indicus TaxID=137267 RepID=A0AAE3VZM8_9ACTN|nr:hypothetical protein [Catenuloplanes indicus]MDQ0366923.1 hypothetical protein [Catenuloplanes indicus]